ncbi:class I SAM-dependent methyltransferase [Pelagibacteraceae bacterium]|jgi:cephalosporin hydroxylase|nr:class I SAM-dependent methyltransferase [Pelagibacteraceae bacterium]
MKKNLISKITRLSAVRKLGIFIDSAVNYYWNSFPFGNKAILTKEEYTKLWLDEKNNFYPNIDQYEKNNGFKIDKDWLDNLALHTQVVSKTSSLNWQHGRVVFTTIANWINMNPIETVPMITIWETGTARGFSALCMSKALEEQGRPARILTFDVLPHNKKMFWNCIDDHDGPLTRSELLKPWQKLLSNYVIFCQGDTKITLKRVLSERVHIAFLDGSHSYDDVMFEFNQIKKFQFSGDIIIFDDYNDNQFPGLVKAVDEICLKLGYTRLEVSANENRGYVIATKR